MVFFLYYEGIPSNHFILMEKNDIIFVGHHKPVPVVMERVKFHQRWRQKNG